ncbi:MAG TPA: maleylpyruvate isomerase N-terminal domain-containing protein [Candidatus Dormibacteraeota bacterium]|nr:maleylpyruvate isomerase N-terminal domain-containing protein [Candidatus Dormibacteraeota bacterium]
MSLRQGAPVRLDVDVATLLDALERQLGRLAGELEGLDPARWSAPSRCRDWSVGEVAGHLCWGVDTGRELIRRAQSGSDERVFAGFDPRVTPDAALEPVRRRAPAAHLAALRAGSGALLAEARALAERGVDAEADTPLGWVPWPLSLNHLLWDTWLHERDILLPLGIAPVADPVEVRLVASYQLVPLGALLGRMRQRGTVDLRLTGVAAGAFRLEAGDELRVDHPAGPPGEEGCLAGDSLAVIDAISGRGDLAAVAPGPEPMLERGRVLARRLAGV